MLLVVAPVTGLVRKTLIYGRKLMALLLIMYALQGGGCQQIKNLIKNVKAGTIKMQPELLPRRLNCLWRADAATTVVGSSVSTPAASIGQVMFIVPVCTTCTSI